MDNKSCTNRLLIFGDSSSIITNILVEKTLHLIDVKNDIELSGVVDTAIVEPIPKIKRLLKVCAFIIAKWLFNPQENLSIKGYVINNLYDICKKFNVKVIVPSKRDINALEFVNFLKETIKPNIGLALGCPQIMKKEFLEHFDVLINYHNSLLPKYRGLNATSWSIYSGEKKTGFSYHLINKNIDDGNVLLQDAIPISDKMSSFDLELMKTEKASKYIPNLLEMIIIRSKGIPQKGKPSYYGKKELEAIITIDNSSKLAFDEIKRRLSAFNVLIINVNGEYFNVTNIKKIERDVNPRISFLTRDSVRVKLIRFSYLPYAIYNVYRFLKK
jgi:methionyl-tRNA formyltransferase